MKQSLNHWLSQPTLWKTAFIILALTVLFLSTTERDYAVGAAANDKINHGIAFLSLAFAACLGWPRRLIAAVVLVIGYGMLIEIIQSFLPYRQFSMLDWVADIVGALIGLALSLWLVRSRR